jgi:hypothetical protein
VRELSRLEVVHPEVRARGLQVGRGSTYVLLRLMLVGQMILRSLVSREDATLPACWVL